MADNLYAWADTTHVGVGEHTWVTSYAPGDGVPDPAMGDYWYCWGDPHERCRELGMGNGGREFANLLARPHDPQDGVGLRYKYDGLCHQMANRLLRFSYDEMGQPVRVSDAKGYQLSVGMYGEYGGKFVLSSPDCLAKWEKIVSEYGGFQS